MHDWLGFMESTFWPSSGGWVGGEPGYQLGGYCDMPGRDYEDRQRHIVQ